MTLISRIEIALERTGLTASELAKGVGLTPAALTKLARRPGSSMRPENVARIARFLGCDVYWLCTGEGTPEMSSAALPRLSALTLRAAMALDTLPVEHRAYAFLAIELIAAGELPELPSMPRPFANGSLALKTTIKRRKSKTAPRGAAVEG